MTDVQIRYLSGDEIVLSQCTSLTDVKLRLATLHSRFILDIALFDSANVLLSDDVSSSCLPPALIVAVLDTSDRPETDDRWEVTLCAHAEVLDSAGLARAAGILTPTHAPRMCGRAIVRLLKESRATAQNVELLLTIHADPNYVYSRHTNRPVLQCAVCRTTDSRVISLLLDARADAASVDHLGSTALHACAASASRARSGVDVARLLINARASVNVRNVGGATPAVLAARGGAADVVKLLVETRAEIESALDAARSAGHDDVVHALIRGGLTVDREEGVDEG